MYIQKSGRNFSKTSGNPAVNNLSIYKLKKDKYLVFQLKFYYYFILSCIRALSIHILQFSMLSLTILQQHLVTVIAWLGMVQLATWLLILDNIQQTHNIVLLVTLIYVQHAKLIVSIFLILVLKQLVLCWGTFKRFLKPVLSI